MRIIDMLSITMYLIIKVIIILWCIFSSIFVLTILIITITPFIILYKMRK
jgi:hypothetical protein